MNISTIKKRETNIFYEAILNHLHQHTDFFMKALISTKHGGQWEVEHENLTILLLQNKITKLQL